jgi:hypothetical protein
MTGKGVLGISEYRREGQKVGMNEWNIHKGRTEFPMMSNIISGGHEHLSEGHKRYQRGTNDIRDMSELSEVQMGVPLTVGPLLSPEARK